MLKPVFMLLCVVTLLLNTLQSYAAEVDLYFVRHGETRFNKSGRVQGWADSPLTPDGVRTAKALGQGLKSTPFIAVWTSDTGRARDTAQLILQARDATPPLIESRALREVSYGQFEGQATTLMWDAAASTVGLASQAALMRAFAAGEKSIADVVNALADADAAHEAEHYPQAAARLKQAVDEIARQAQRAGGGNVLIVSHGMAITVLLHELGYSAQRKPLKNASVTRVHYDAAGHYNVEDVDNIRFVKRGQVEQ